MSDPSPADEFKQKDALDHSWAWFQVHAFQRMQLVNYFIIAVAFLTTGYAAGLTADKPALSVAVSALGVALTICFHLMERRTRELVRAAELALKELEQIMAEQTGIGHIRLVERVERPTGRFIVTYGTVIKFLHGTTMAGFLTGFLYAVYPR